MDNNVGMAQRYEHEIPDGYEARIEGNKVILEQKENEDEKTRQELLSFIRAEKKYTPETVPGEHWDRWIAYLERQKEHHPVEWSEVEQNIIDCAVDVLEKELPSLAASLKSLRSQPHWKPSEEQMKALKEAVDEHCEADGLHPLYTLYDDLKKL